MTDKPETRTTSSVDGDTRKQISKYLLTQGPITAGELGRLLGLSATGVRRHLDNLVEEGIAEIATDRPVQGGRSRGRPAKTFALTEKGRYQFGHNYDNMALIAMTALRDAGGVDAVKHVAQERIRSIIKEVPPARDSAESIRETTEKLAEALDRSGHAATIKQGPGGVQICQHHCPVSQLAEEFPEICEAEVAMIAELTGLHVQQLASIADGHGICTTNIPLVTKIEQHKNERSGS